MLRDDLIALQKQAEYHQNMIDQIFGHALKAAKITDPDSKDADRIFDMIHNGEDVDDMLGRINAR